MWRGGGRVKNILYMVCFNCGRVTAVDTGYCRHCKAPLFVDGSLPPSEDVLEYDLEVGMSYGNRVGLKLIDVQRHIGIFGLTGYGKTTFVKKLLLELYRKKIFFTVFDWEGEYRDVAEGLDIDYFHIPLDNFRFNPFDSHGIPLDDYSKWIADLLMEIYVETILSDKSFSPQMMYVLNKAVRDVVENKGGFKDLLKYIDKYSKGLPSGRSTKLALYNRFYDLVSGSLAKIWSRNSSIDEITSKYIVFDISNLSRFSVLNARFFTLLLIRKIFDEALSRKVGSKLKHVTIIEEIEEICGRVFKLRRTWTPLQFLLRMRKRGEGMIFVSHSPSLIDRGLMKSIGSIVCFRLQDMSDAKIVAEFLGLHGDGWRFITSLKVGEAIIHTSNIPFRVNILKPVFPKLSHLEKRFLKNVFEKPFISVRERRFKLGLSGKKYSEIEEKLINLGYIRPIKVYTGLGRPIKLYETSFSGESIVHRFGVDFCKKVLEKMGFKVKLGRRPDIVILDYNIAIEIETGRNIVKGKFIDLLEKYSKVIVVVLDKKVLRKMRRKRFKRIRFVSLIEFRKMFTKFKA